MLKWLESRYLWGGLLILGGVTFLLQNLGIVRLGALFWALLLVLAGVFFLSVFFQNRANWWALIPGISLLSVALLVIFSWVEPDLSRVWGGVIVLGGIGVSFMVVYLIDRQHWWAIILMGVMLTLASIPRLAELIPGVGIGSIFFLGLGLTFVLVAILPNPQGSMKWAWIPAGLMVLMGVLLLVPAENLIAYIWPAGLILAGGYLIMRTLRPRAR